MKKNKRRRNVILAIRDKRLLTQHACLARHHHPPYHRKNGNLQGWFQLRKRANQRLRNRSSGNIEIVENGYRGDYERHWLRDGRCDHVFKASLKELVVIGTDRICPFCNGAKDMERYGTIEAVQEQVHCVSYGLIEFSSDNILASSNDGYTFYCTVHHIVLETSFDRFLELNGEICSYCDFDKGL